MELLSGPPAFVGDGLDRPECVLTLASGEVWVTDRSRGVRCAIGPNRSLLPALGTDPQRFLPNGIALLPDGCFLIANIALDGGLWRLEPHGRIRPELTEVDGEPLAVTNFVLLDHFGRLWISVSTRRLPRELAFVRGVADGFIVVVANGAARIVADGVGFTNEVHVSIDGKWLYANETVARRLSRYPIAADASLGARETVVEFGAGVFPDGMALDIDGGVWVTSVVSNRLLRVEPSGNVVTILDQSDPEVIAKVEERFASGEFGRADMDAGRAGSLGNLSSLAFGEADMRTIYLGSLFGTRLGMLRSEHAGFEQAHRRFTVHPDFLQ
ncbi:MAG: hypothetical protein NVS2B17_15610 [Candidatus Velthaea sp.]